MCSYKCMNKLNYLNYVLVYALISLILINNNYQLIGVKGAEQQNGQKPHIIFILADDLGFDDVSFHGSGEFLTPNIDALAYHGKILQRLYAPAMCTPSRAALLTGRYPIHTGTQHFVISNEEPWSLPTNLTTLPEIFQKAGYSTNLIGKWHLGYAKLEYTPTFRGFDYHYGYWGSFIDYYQRRSKMPTPHFDMGYDFYRNRDLECADRGTYVTDLLTHETERIILANNNTKPLLLVLSHLAVHAGNDGEPLQAPLEEIEKFGYIKDPNRRTYAAMVSRLDQSVGRVMAALEKANMLQNTVVIFQSDNGGPSVGLFANSASNWPLRGQKHTPWEGGVRVSGAIWSALISGRGTIFPDITYIGDWLPTLAAAANISINKTALRLDGINQWPALSSNADAQKNKTQREIVHFMDDVLNVVAYQRGDWKYINGTTAAGSYDNVLTYRELSDIDPRNLDYFSTIENSITSQLLRKYDEFQINRELVNQLRRDATICCGHGVQHNCSPLIEECLYNVAIDPCERNNLATTREHMNILERMRRRVRQHRRTAWPMGNRKGNLSYSPSHHRCTWTNFLQEEPSVESLNCDLTGPPCESDV